MEQLERGLRRAYALVACCVLLACGQEPAAQDAEAASPASVSTTSSTLAQACWPTHGTDEQKVCSDGWFFSIHCYKREASVACGPGADGGFALCRHSSHGEAPAVECQLDGIYTPPNHSLTQARAHAEMRWNAAGGVGPVPFSVQPLCTSCTDLTANASDILPTELAMEMNTAAGRTPGRSGVSADGAATYSIPLWVPPGRMGMQPGLSVDYNSRSGDGILGKGWSLGGISRITRCTRTLAQDGAAEPIRFDATDRFCLDGVRLVAVNGVYGGHLTEYRTESNIFAKVVSFNPDDLGPTSFKAWLKDGRIMTFGDGWAARVEGLRTQVVPSTEPSGSTTTHAQARYAWSITHVHDRAGNFMRYVYALNAGGTSNPAVEQWVSSITYTHSTVAGAPEAASTIGFIYKQRTDPTSEYVSGFKLGHGQLLERVSMYGPGIGGGALLRYYDLKYATPTITGANLLMSLQECTGETYDGVCKNPTSFTWTQGATHFQHYDTQITDVASIPAGYPSSDYPEHLWNIHTPDLNGDGKDDLLYREFIDPPNGPPQGIWWARLSTGNGFGPRRQTSIPPSVNYWNPVWNGRLADVDRDGKVDLLKLKESDGLYEVYRSRGDGYLLAQGESAGEADTMWWDNINNHIPSIHLADLNGDGLPEAIRALWAGTSNNGIKWGFRLNTAGGLGPYEAWPMQAFMAGQEDKAYAASVDGSGRTAFLVRDHGVDPYRYSALMLGPDGSPIKSVTTLKRTSATDSPYWFLDITGDGLTDALRIEDSYKPTGGKAYYQGGRLSVFINTGNGFLPGKTVTLSPAVNWLGPTEYSDNPVTDYGIRVGEFNGDGRPDFFVANSITGRTKWLVLESQNDGTLSPRMLDVPLGDLAVLGFKMHQVLDVNGDGQTDILQVENGVVQLYLRIGEKPDLLHTVHDGQQSPAVFDYTYYNASNPYLAMDLPASPVSRGLWVVWRHSVGNGTGGLSQYQYTYDDARMDLHGRGFLGFKTRTMLDAQTGATTTTQYEHLDTRVGTAYPYAGRPTLERTELTTEDGVAHILERRTTYQTTAEANGQVLFAWPETLTETRREVPAGQPPASAVVTFGQTVSMTYDAFGNLTRSHSRSLYGGIATGDELITESTYDNDTTGWLLGLMRSTSTTSLIPGGQSTTRRVDFQYEPTTGLLKNETVEPTVSSLYLRTNYQRDALGRAVNVTEYDWGGNSRSTVIAYDAVEGTFPAVVTNGLGHQTRLAWHPGLGVQMAEQEPNGLVRRWKYDGFGRVRGVESPDGANVSVGYGQRLGVSTFGLAITVQQAGGPTRVIEYDEWDRPVWATEQGFNGEIVHHVRTYDWLGRLHLEYRPYTANETPRATEYTYDKLGRLTYEQQPDGSFSEYRYSTRLTERWDARRNLHTFHQDVLGRMAESTDVSPEGKRLQTRYTYGTFNTLTKVEQLTNDVSQHATHLAYDLHGRQARFLEYHTPSRFQLEYTAYNAWGELRETTDASQRVTRLQRDRLGRIVSITNADGQTRFTWDTGAGKGLGQLASSLSPDGVSSSHAYDALGRLSDTTWNVLGDSFQVTHQYDAFGRPSAILYPAVPGGARMQARFGYTTSGQLSSVVGPPGIGNLWAAEARTATGHIQTEVFGNGVRSSREYDPMRALLKRIDTTFQSTTGTHTIQALAYDFDANGNLQTRADELAGVSESFGYDHLDRLKDWTVNAQGRRSVHSYRHDDLGNFLGRDVLEGDGTSISLTYDRTQGFGTYAVTRSTLGDYTYDANGNQVTAPGRQVEYTAMDKPRRILKGTDATLLGYTAEGQRAYKQSPNGDVTIYIGGLYERRKTATETMHIHHIPADGRIVVEEYWREAGGIITNVNRVFLHHDHLGSVETLTDQAGGVISHAKYDPFGARADPTNPAKALAPVPAPGLVRWGFTGHEQDDELGLINMRGRMYDPLIGRFLSRDPFVQFPHFGQSYNRYSYVLNNPLRWTDPSGFLMKVEEEDQVTDSVTTTENGSPHITFCVGPCSEGEGEGAQGTTSEEESTVEVEAPEADDNGSKTTTVRTGTGGGKGKKGKVTVESLQLALDAGGMIPGIGIAFDIASAGLSAYRGNWGDAGMSLIGAIPGIGDAVKGAWLATKLGKSASKAGAIARHGLRQTGAGTAASAADEAYDAIRASTSDVAEIAANTGLKVSSVQKVKDHIFMNEHLLDRYVDYGVPAVMSRFDSSAGMASAWNRLRAGTHTPADMSLLRHEAAEAWFMRRHGPGYSAAHNAAQRRFPAPDLGD